MAAKKLRLPKLPILLVIALVLLVGIAVIFKSTTAPKGKIYAKVKVSQGFWWASTTKPNVWFTKAIKKGDKEVNLFGDTVAEVTKVRYYPYFSENQSNEDKYDIYLNVVLSADFNSGTGEAIFKRGAVAAGAPIELNLGRAQITGTVIDVSNEPFEENYVEKEITLAKRFAFPWEYSAINVGETYHDGENVVFEILSKKRVPTTALSPDSFGNLTTSTVETNQYVTVRARVRVREENGQYFFGEEKIVAAGSPLPVITDTFVFKNYIVSSIE